MGVLQLLKLIRLVARFVRLVHLGLRKWDVERRRNDRDGLKWFGCGRLNLIRMRLVRVFVRLSPDVVGEVTSVRES